MTGLPRARFVLSPFVPPPPKRIIWSGQKRWDVYQQNQAFRFPSLAQCVRERVGRDVSCGHVSWGTLPRLKKARLTPYATCPYGWYHPLYSKPGSVIRLFKTWHRLISGVSSRHREQPDLLGEGGGSHTLSPQLQPGSELRVVHVICLNVSEDISQVQNKTGPYVLCWKHWITWEYRIWGWAVGLGGDVASHHQLLGRRWRRILTLDPILFVVWSFCQMAPVSLKSLDAGKLKFFPLLSHPTVSHPRMLHFQHRDLVGRPPYYHLL